MKKISQSHILIVSILAILSLGIITCGRLSSAKDDIVENLRRKGLVVEEISAESFYKGIAPAGFEKVAGAPYKPSYNEEPNIPAQCWIKTSYGTQNACKYCHTDYLSTIEHGNNFPISDDQITYSFPTKNLNRILWQNIIYPQNIIERLKSEGIEIPKLDDVDYVRHDNWSATFNVIRGNGNKSWLNSGSPNANYILFPALNPNHLYPFVPNNPTNNGANGYINPEGFVVDESEKLTGWRAINFFPYAIFTPLTGSVSGIYIRLPEIFMTQNGQFDIEIYKQNLDLLEKNIKNHSLSQTHFSGDAKKIGTKKGFYPVGTEFAHPLHYVDLLADGQTGEAVDGVLASEGILYEFPGTRSKRVKEIRYMYKWKEVDIDDIGDEEGEEGEEGEEVEFGVYYGKEGQGWVDNGAGWIIAAFIENRHGELRPQTTEELAQCIGCHSNVGNTIDAVWSFQRKLPGLEGWADMNYGQYFSKSPNLTKLKDYHYKETGMGEQGYFYYTVVGADLFGVMPAEIRKELTNFTKSFDIKKELGISFAINEILDDDILRSMGKSEREPRLLARQKLMRHYSKNLEYLSYCNADDNYYIKGDIFYPTLETMKANIQGYRKIVLDQSFNLGKDVFGSETDHIPFTFRSDGTVLDEKSRVIPVGEVIYSRPYNKQGEGITPTGIIEGDAFDKNGNRVEHVTDDDRLTGRLSFSGTLDLYYNPILSGKSIRK
ncbi:MAG: hypothetical protein RBT74_06055 [Tenuifilaceae bacterium]|jgi:hypothetical protein|nr:hypothetical protein [Tenuifilaceae bacterium]